MNEITFQDANIDEDGLYCNWLWNRYQKNPDWKKHPRRFIEEFNMQGKILDVGCGFGHFVNFARKRNKMCVGIDINLSIIRKGMQELGSKFLICASAEELPIKDSSFDWIFANQIIEHLPNPENFLSEAKRVLSPFGKLIISTPNRLTYFCTRNFLVILKAILGKNKIDPTHIREYTLGEMKRFLKKNHFELISSCFEGRLSTSALTKYFFSGGFTIVAQKREE